LDYLLPAGPAREDLVGDLEELYLSRAATSRIAADLWFWRETLLVTLRARSLAAASRRRAAVPSRSRRGVGPLHRVVETARELRAAVRRLRRSPGFAVPAVLTLTLGIGACAGVLTVVDGVLLKPLPYPNADGLVVIEHELPGFDMPGSRTATIGGMYAQLADYLERSTAFEEIGGFTTFDAALADQGAPQLLHMASATAGFFRALGLRPLLGRLIGDDDPAPFNSAVSPSLLTDGLWARRFGRDPGVLGRAIRAQGFDQTIVGVLPASLAFPPQPVELWVSHPVSLLRDKPEWSFTRMLGRLAPGVTPEQARDELDRLIPGLPDRFPGPLVRRLVVDGKVRAKVTPLHTWLVGDVAQSLWLLLAAAAIVLAIGCVNVTNLILVRTEARRREVALRRAVGASTGHLVRHFAADSLILVSVAATAGAVLARLGIDALVRFGPSSLPRLEAVEAGWLVAAFTGVPAMACVSIFALVPWLAAGRSASSELAGGRRVTAGRSQFRIRHVLVAFQFAMALVLLVGAGLIVRSFLALNRVDLGFEPRGALTFRIVFPFQEIQAAGPAGNGPATPFYDRLAERIAALPGVEAVGYGTCVPLSDSCTQGGSSLRREDRPQTSDSVPATLFLMVSPGYLEALGVPLLEGRSLEPRDHLQRTHAAVISAEMARQFFPDGDPIGKRLVQDGTSWKPFTVVGVVGDVKHEHLRKATTPFIYVPVLGDFAPGERWAVSYVVRTDGVPLALVETVRRTSERLRSDIPIANVDTLSAIVTRSTGATRFALWLLALAAAATLVLSAIGAYSVMAYVVTLRRSEIGVRLALGASGRQVRSLVLRQGIAWAAAGLALGLAGAALTGRWLQSLLFEVVPSDPPTYAAAVSGLALIALLAVSIPARRAARLDPARILRAE
jgi:putative ABC transport system permease protein